MTTATELTFEQFCQDARKFYLSVKPQQRYGQAHMNYLREVNHSLFLAVPPDLDPWDNDELVNQFLYWIGEHWN